MNAIVAKLELTVGTFTLIQDNLNGDNVPGTYRQLEDLPQIVLRGINRETGEVTNIFLFSQFNLAPLLAMFPFIESYHLLSDLKLDEVKLDTDEPDLTYRFDGDAAV